MKLRTALSAIVFAAASLAIVPTASAKELREPAAHLVIDVPDAWVITTEGRWAMAYPQDQSFHLRLVANNKAFTRGQEARAEEHLLTFLKEHLDDIKVERH